MEVNYKKLWKLLIDRDMKKQDLQSAANISAVTIAKLGRNENVTTAILAKICTSLNCNVGDIMDILVTRAIKGAQKQRQVRMTNKNVKVSKIYSPGWVVYGLASNKPSDRQVIKQSAFSHPKLTSWRLVFIKSTLTVPTLSGILRKLNLKIYLILIFCWVVFLAKHLA